MALWPRHYGCVQSLPLSTVWAPPQQLPLFHTVYLSDVHHTKPDIWVLHPNLGVTGLQISSSSEIHCIPCSKGEQLENSVSSVLNSGAAILAGLEDVEVSDQVAVVFLASPTFDKGQQWIQDLPVQS